MKEEYYQRWEKIIQDMKDGRTVTEIAKDFDLSKIALITWVQLNGIYLSKAVGTLPVTRKFPKHWKPFIG